MPANELLLVISGFSTASIIVCLSVFLAKAKHKQHQLEKKLVTSEAKLSSYQQQVESETSQRQWLEKRFQSIAAEIFQQQHQRNQQSTNEQLSHLLKPFQQEMQHFRMRLEQTRESDLKQRSELTLKIEQLAELNQQMSADAQSLTQALTSQSQVQGSWGEMILERVLELSGLRPNKEYQLQVSSTDNGKTLRPDALIFLPANRKVVIDAKVSLTAYHHYCNATNESERQQALKEHQQSITSHIKNLASKEYHQHQAFRGLDFVLMFMPIESALSVLASHSESLFANAIKNNLLIVTPNTLFGVLRVINMQWQIDSQNKNAQKIAEQGAKLYQQLARFVEDFERIGKAIERSQESYQQAHHRLTSQRGNTLDQANKLKQLGINTSHQIENPSD